MCLLLNEATWRIHDPFSSRYVGARFNKWGLTPLQWGCLSFCGWKERQAVARELKPFSQVDGRHEMPSLQRHSGTFTDLPCTCCVPFVLHTLPR